MDILRRLTSYLWSDKTRRQHIQIDLQGRNSPGYDSRRRFRGDTAPVKKNRVDTNRTDLIMRFVDATHKMARRAHSVSRLTCAVVRPLRPRSLTTTKHNDTNRQALERRTAKDLRKNNRVHTDPLEPQDRRHHSTFPQYKYLKPTQQQRACSGGACSRQRLPV